MGKQKRTATTTASNGELFDPQLFPKSIALLQMAKSDRNAARVLLRQQQFPQAVFSLQQAVEKAVKAIGLSTRVIAVGELQSAISHKAINVFLFAIRKALVVANARMGDQKAIATLDGFLRAGENARDRFATTAKPTASELDRWISAHRSLREDLQGVLATPAGAQVIEAVQETITEPLPFATEEIPKRIFEAMIVLAGLYFLSLATLGHAITSRYGDNTQSALDMHTTGHPLVARLDELIDITGECVDFAQSAFAFVSSWG